MEKLVWDMAHCPSFMLSLRLDVEVATLRFVALKAETGISYACVMAALSNGGDPREARRQYADLRSQDYSRIRAQD
jgi:hypothetical protein